MNLKEKINLFKNEIKNETPDIDINFVLKTAHIDSYTPSKAKRFFNVKVFLRFSLSFMIVFILGFLIRGLNIQKTEKAGDNSYFPNFDSPIPFFPIITPEFPPALPIFPPLIIEQSPLIELSNPQKYGFASASLVSLFINNQDLLYSDINPPIINTTLNDEIDTFLNRQLNSFEIFIDNYQYTQKVSDLVQYTYLIEFNGKTLLNEDKTYLIYFNIYNNNELDFLVLYNNETYILNGSLNDNDDLTVKIGINSKSYLTFTSSSNHYDYDIIRNNVIISKSRIQYINHNDSITFCITNTLNTIQKPTFYITTAEDNRFNISYIMAVKYTIPNYGSLDGSFYVSQGNISITSIRSDQYIYTINSSEVLEKDRLGN